MARVAVAGTSGFIGAAVCQALSASHEVVALTRSMARAGEGAPSASLQLRACDHYSRKELERALEGVDYAVYLVHNRDPSSRLDQAETRDRDLLVADNFARAASRRGVKQIVTRAQLLPGAVAPSEREEVLASHGVPLTTLRTSLVVGPGGELTRLLVRMVRTMPWIPLPPTAETGIRPLLVADLVAAIGHCVGDPDAFHQSYEVAGPERVTLRGLLEDAAGECGARPRIQVLPTLGPRGFAALLRLLNPSLHPEFLHTFLATLDAEVQVPQNLVERAVAGHPQTFQEALRAAVRAEMATQAAAPPHRAQDDRLIRQDARVRSIQRMHLPRGRNAAWMAEHYFAWLGTLLPPLLRTERGESGGWTVFAHPGRLRMLALDFKPTHSSPDRVMYFITGGLLARFLGGRTARLEFRDFLEGRFTMVAIHDFNPALPWYVYRFTQAVIHGVVMAAYQRHMARLARA